MKQSLRHSRALACASAIVCTLLWGTAFPFIKLGYGVFRIANTDVGAQLLFAGLRFTAAGLMVGLFVCLKERRFVLIKKNELAPAALLGSVQTLGQYLLTYVGISLTTGANTSIITSCASFLTVLFAPLFFRSDRLTARKLLGCALGFGGVLAMNGGGGFSAQTSAGDALIFGSTVFAAGGNLIAKRVTRERDPVRITAFQLLLGGMGLTCIGLVFGGRLDVSQWRGTLILLWLALVSAAAFSIWTVLLKHHPAGSIAVFNLLVPVFGTLLSGLLLGENVFRMEILLSLTLIAAGIICVNLSKEGKMHG